MVSKLCATVILACPLVVPSLFAAENAVDEEMTHLLDIGFEELVTVSIASKKQETINQAPGIVSVVSADDIQRYGYRNLRDILDRQPHIQVTGSNLFPHNKVTMRGNGLSHTDNTVLLLLNGRPIREAVNNSANHDLYESFPVEIIKQLEIIRGPGSVLYGSNAFAGAINIVTKDAPDTAEGNLKLSYGSFDRKRGSVTGGGKVGEFEFFGSLSTQNVGGEDFNNIANESGRLGTYKTGSQGSQLVLNANYKGFTLNGFISDLKRDHAQSQFLLPSSNLNTQRVFIDVGYKHEWNTDWSSSLNLLYHHYDYDFFISGAGFTAGGEAAHYLTELSNQGKLTDKLSVLFGGSYNAQDGTFHTGSVRYDDYSLGLYGQFEYQATDWIKLISGVQFNRPEGLQANYSPRFAAIFNLGQGWGAKLLYGEAFREGTPVERYLTAPTVTGNPSINPETIETFDAQLFFDGKHSSFSITYFHSEHKELITRVGVFPQNIVNSGEISYQGIELEGRHDFGNNWSILGNLSYQTSDKDDGTDDATYAPDWMAKAGLSYSSPRGYQISVFNSYFAASTLQNEDVTTVSFNNKNADSYNLLTANIKFNLGEIISEPALYNVDLSFYGDNLLNEDIYFPSVNRRNVNSLPHHSGRGIYATINIKFE